jgi:hypothetical protein
LKDALIYRTCFGLESKIYLGTAKLKFGLWPKYLFADQEKTRADQEKMKVEQLAAQLRALGIEPNL